MISLRRAGGRRTGRFNFVDSKRTVDREVVRPPAHRYSYAYVCMDTDTSIRLLRPQPRMRASAETSTATYYMWQATLYAAPKPLSCRLVKGGLKPMNDVASVNLDLRPRTLKKAMTTVLSIITEL